MLFSFRPGRLRGRCCFAHETFQFGEAPGPEVFVEAEPFAGAGQRPGFQSADMRASAHLAADQPGLFERLDMFRGGGERHFEGFGQLADRLFAIGELAQHVPSGRIAKGVKDGVELEGVLFNHMV